MGEEVEQLVAVHEEDLLHGDGLVGVGHEDLEDVETLVLDHLPVAAQEVHADLQVLASVHVRGHDIVVRTVE